MTTTPVKMLAAFAFSFGTTTVVIAEDLTINRLLASQCAQCHGSKGRVVSDMDDLRGESFSDLFEEMMEMRAEEIPEDVMEHQTLEYTEDQIRRISVYCGSLSGD